MPQKTTSQVIARIFESIGFIALIPALLFLIFPTLGLIVSAITLQWNMFFFCLIPFPIIGFGSVLLSGYFKHSRGRLAKEKLSSLWLGTILFHALPLIPSLVWFCQTFYFGGNDHFHRTSPAAYFVSGVFITWLATALFLSIFAFVKND